MLMTAPMDCLNLAPMGSERTDEELMLAYAGGDLLAFEMLYRRHRGTLYRFLLRSLRQRADADELFQETWSRAVAARERYRVEAKFTTWLLQIAHNLVIDRFRRAARRLRPRKPSSCSTSSMRPRTSSPIAY